MWTVCMRVWRADNDDKEDNDSRIIDNRSNTIDNNNSVRHNDYNETSNWLVIPDLQYVCYLRMSGVNVHKITHRTSHGSSFITVAITPAPPNGRVVRIAYPDICICVVATCGDLSRSCTHVQWFVSFAWTGFPIRNFSIWGERMQDSANASCKCTCVGCATSLVLTLRGCNGMTSSNNP